jgi:predicted DCC family thiol-disulfide oxidoreductase YuxK
MMGKYNQPCPKPYYFSVNKMWIGEVKFAGKATGNPMENKKVVIFDGVCNFCNSSVNFIMDQDRKDTFRFAANQSGSGQQILKDFGESVSEVDTVMLVENGKLYKKSTAAIRIARGMGLPWSLAYGFVIVPAFIRDLIYDLIAKNRYRLFGKREACRLPTPAERARFLD